MSKLSFSVESIMADRLNGSIGSPESSSQSDGSDSPIREGKSLL